MSTGTAGSGAEGLGAAAGGANADRRALRTKPVMILALISVLQGVALLGYAIFDIIEAITVGITGPAPVSNSTALTLQILLFVIFGAGLIAVAWGWWQVRRWARAPFVLAQLIALVVGVPLAQAAEATARVPGILLSMVAVIGLVLVFLPKTTQSLVES